MAVKRLSGKTLSITVDAKEYSAEVSEYKYKEEKKDAGTITFADAQAGNTGQGILEITIVQSLDAASFHQVLMDNPDKRDVPFRLAPGGNAEPSAALPHFVGTLDFPKFRPELGIKAGDDDSTVEVEFKVKAWEKKTTK